MTIDTTLQTPQNAEQALAYQTQARANLASFLSENGSNQNNYNSTQQAQYQAVVAQNSNADLSVSTFGSANANAITNNSTLTTQNNAITASNLSIAQANANSASAQYLSAIASSTPPDQDTLNQLQQNVINTSNAYDTLNAQYQNQQANNTANAETSANIPPSTNAPTATAGALATSSATVPTTTGSTATATPDNPTNSISGSTDVVGAGSNDFRLKIRPKTALAGQIFSGSGILAPLQQNQGVIFPYTPSISYSHDVNYTQFAPVHMNQDYYFYNSTSAIKFQINGQFSCQNTAESQYTLACIHFFRSVTKMHFGSKDPDIGLPAPVLLLSGYGNYMFNDLPIIITRFSHDLPTGIDLVSIAASDGSGAGWLPAITTLTIECTVQQTPQKLLNFNWYDFASGKLMTQGGWL